MIVIDASALIEILLRTPAAAAAIRLLSSAGQPLHAPHLLDAEVAQVLRRFVAAGLVDPERGRAALTDLAAFPILRHRHDILLPRVWELRDNLTAYDACYVVLAEVLDATLVTRDRRLAAASGHWARVEVV